MKRYLCKGSACRTPTIFFEGRQVANSLRWGVLFGLMAVLLVYGGPLQAQTPPTAIQGRVIDEAGPVAGAVVRVQATPHYTRTDDQGRFTLNDLTPDTAIHLTAWAPGYFVAGAAADPGDDDVTLTLHPHPTVDNPDYEFISPLLDMDNPTACGHCHVDRTDSLISTMPVDEWLLDAHSQSAINLRFLSLYNGTTLTGETGSPTTYRFDSGLGVNVPVVPSQGLTRTGPGFRLDFPAQGGNCATCHVPILALDAPYDADPNHAAGVAAEGVTCDFCHKVADVRFQANGLPDPSLPGVLSLDFLRPHEGEQVFIGPFDDTPGEDIYSALQDQSQFCAACHFGEFWGVTMYNSFGEWLDSPYSNPVYGQTCQDCHMPHVGAEVFAQLPSGAEGHAATRDPATIFSHRMPGALDEDLLQETATLDVAARQADDELLVTVRVTNSGAGHHIPTDNPLRNMILLVRATDTNGNPLPLLDGPTIPEWGGVGDPAAGYVAGQPGVLYAKVLADFYTGETPVYAYWRQTRLVSDNRLPAFATDETVYTFALPPDSTPSGDGGPVTVEAELVLRRAFIELMDVKGWDTPDMVMEQAAVEVIP